MFWKTGGLECCRIFFVCSGWPYSLQKGEMFKRIVWISSLRVLQMSRLVAHSFGHLFVAWLQQTSFLNCCSLWVAGPEFHGKSKTTWRQQMRCLELRVLSFLRFPIQSRFPARVKLRVLFPSIRLYFLASQDFRKLTSGFCFCHVPTIGWILGIKLHTFLKCLGFGDWLQPLWPLWQGKASLCWCCPILEIFITWPPSSWGGVLRGPRKWVTWQCTMCSL